MAEHVLRQRFSAATPDEAAHAIRSVFGVGTVTTGGGPFSYEQASLVDDGISVTRVSSSGTGVQVSTESAPDLVVIVVRQGVVTIQRDSDEVTLTEGAIGLLPIRQPVAMTWGRVALDVYSFPLSSLTRLLGSAGQPLRLHAPILTPNASPLAAFWRRLADVVAGQVLNEADLYSRELVRSQMTDALVAATIEVFSLSDSAEDDSRDDEDVLRRARMFLDARLGEPIGVPDVARAAGVSVRGLQLLFQRRLATTPVLQLRRMRLEAARSALLGAGPGTTVGAVARRVGYTNLGRFSAHYRAEFDEAPSGTLQRSLATR